MQRKKDQRWIRLGVALGDASYAMYLSHYFVIQAVRKLVAPIFPWLDPSGGVGAVVTVLLVTAVGAGCYRLLDRPLVRWARQSFSVGRA